MNIYNLQILGRDGVHFLNIFLMNFHNKNSNEISLKFIKAVRSMRTYTLVV